MSRVIDVAALTPDDVVAIRALVGPWTSACVSRDWDALTGLCTDDVAFLPPGEPVVEGGNVRGWLDRFPVIAAMAWDFDHLEGLGQLACGRGWVRMTLEVSGQQVAFDGKFTDVFRKGPDGTWRFALVVWNSNTAA